MRITKMEKWWIILSWSAVGLVFLASQLWGAEPTLTIHRGVVDGVTNVRDHGADGSDTIDDSDAIQAALHASADGGPVYFMPGKYLVSKTLEVRGSSVTLFGFGGPHAEARPVEIVYSGQPGTTLFRLAGDVTAGFTIRGMFLTGDFPKGTTRADCLTIEGGDEFTTGFTLDSVGIYGFRRGLLLQKTGAMLWLGDVLVEGCNITQCDQAVVCRDGISVNNLDIVRSKIRQNRGTTGASAAPIIDIRGNRLAIEACCLEGQIQPIRVTRSNAVKITGCYFEGNSRPGVENFLVSAHRVKGLRFVDNYQRLLAAEKYVELVQLSECIDLVVERLTVDTGKWEMP